MYKVSITILGIYGLMSLITFLVYAGDKTAAKRGRWRTPEQTLHLLSLLGGWPGALIAQQLLHHKNRKKSFQLIYWITVLLNLLFIGWLYTAAGTSLINQFSAQILQAVE